MKNRVLFVFFFMLFVWINTNAQINIGGEPVSFMFDQSLKSNLEYEIMQTVDVESLIAEDKINEQYKDIPWRFGFELEVNYNPSNSGVWDELPKGDKLWRLGIKSDGAFTINLIFNNYHLPPNAKLFVYSADKSEIIGAFTDANNQEDRYFATTLIKSDAIIIEYYEPYNAAFAGELNLETVTHGYQDAYSYAKAFGGSGSCNVNVACPESSGWENEIRSVTHLITGGYVCTGALINNAENNGTPYYLSADHCYSTPGALVFWFNWESATCANPGSSPSYNSMSGSVQRASNSASDFWLVELNSTPPASYNVYYAGWNRQNAANSSSVCIHHPSGDIKKISFDYNSYTSDLYLGTSGVAGSHWKITDWDLGTTEGGSSGSPLFDPNHRIVGQLHGGYAACGNNDADWYGKLSTSWDYGSTAATRLSDWLDPNNTGTTAINGYDPNTSTELTANFSGNPTSVAVGNAVTFTNLSNGPNPITSYSWSFPGGTPSSASTAGPHTITYNNLGTYDVTLTVGDGIDTDIEPKTNYINVINCSYCASTYSNTADDWISNVSFNTINNPSASSTYSDFTAISTDVNPGTTYGISANITVNGGWEQHCLVWFDWNSDCDFDDAGEVFDLGQTDGTAGVHTLSTSVIVPADAVEGITRMRISELYSLDPGACTSSTYGEAEDYTVNVLSGGSPPVANFEVDNTAPGMGETVNFTDLSTNTPTSWAWTFTPSTVAYVGGTTSSSQSPEVQFIAAGDYTVELTATNSSGSDTETKVDYIFVIDVPAADFEADNLAPGIGETVSFTDLSTNNPISWAWTFTPLTVTYVGGTTSSSQDPEVQFDAAGDYTVELTATNISDSDTEIKVDYIFVIDVPAADFEADNLAPGIGETVSFTDLSTNSPTNWAWTFTPPSVTYVGGTTAGSQNPEVQFLAVGDYTVELSVTNISGSDTETKVDYIFVIDVPAADFEADNLAPGIGETASFTDLSTNNPISWAWTFTPPTVTYVGGTTASSQNPQVQFDAAGDFTIELTATNISGSDTETKVDYIFVIDVPFADFIANNTTPVIGEIVDFSDLSSNNPDTWFWSFSPSTITYIGGTTPASQNPQVQFNAAGNYTVELTATNISGSDTEIKTDYINAMIPIFDLELKAFLEGPFNGSLMNSYLSSILPLNQPYNVAPWNYSGTEMVGSIPINVVDWVLIEIRDAASAATATSATEVVKQAAFILNDGSIVDLDGNSNLQFEVAISQNMFVVVWQRNHLGIISNDPLIPSGNLYTYDFSTGINQVFGGIDGHKQISIGVWGMVGGDGNPDGLININDKSPVWEDQAGSKGYLYEDHNLDGDVNNQDKNDMWVPNETKSSQVPN